MTGKYPPAVLRECGVYTHEGAYLWWRGMNMNLGARPVDLWWSGNRAQMDLVLDEVSRLTGGDDA